MMRVAIIFDQYGKPNQPFLMEWFLRLRESRELVTKAFSDKVSGSNGGQVVIFKPGRLSKVWRYLMWLVTSLKRTDLRAYSFRYYELVTFNPDVIHVLNAQQVGLYCDTIRRLESRLVVSFRGYETSVRTLKDPVWKEELKLIYQRADRLHFVSDFLRRKAIELGAPEEKCVVIRRSVDTDFFFPDVRGDSSPLIKLLAVGRLTWQKGYDVLLKSLADLASEGRDLKLTIVGEGPDKDKLESMIDLLGIRHCVQFLGHLNRERLREVFWGADIFVQASVSDALPNSILEASACGLPIVSTTAGGIPEAVRNGFSGMLVRPGDSAELSLALRGVLDDFDLRKSLGVNARRLMEEEFSSRVESARWERFYHSLAI